MDRSRLESIITDAVELYINNFDRYDNNPQLRVNPLTLDVEVVNGSDLAAEIEDSDEAVENAAIAHGMANQEAMDRQVKENPDFYPVKSLLRPKGDTSVPDVVKIRTIVRKYS